MLGPHVRWYSSRCRHSQNRKLLNRSSPRLNRPRRHRQNPKVHPRNRSFESEPGEAKPATPAPAGSEPSPSRHARPRRDGPPRRGEQESEPGNLREAKTKQKSDEINPAREPSSPKSLFDPRVMQAFGELPREGRIRQLCKIEAIARIRQQPFSRYADILVPYGASGGLITNNTLDARGGAFRNGSNWYNVSFKMPGRCQYDESRFTQLGDRRRGSAERMA